MIPDAHIATAGEFLRYAIVGIVSNAALFVLYLLMTHAGMGHKLAATMSYGFGVLQTFYFNRTWAFRDRSVARPALVRYVVVYAVGYGLNMLMLFVLVDRAELPHHWVQGAAVIAVAVLLFLLQKVWVFRTRSTAE